MSVNFILYFYNIFTKINSLISSKDKIISHSRNN